MGGCRCSYRTCSIRSDGKTHMFHFPVYDKVRCHQWIINAKRYEFFNLTVSQVRNRVVCQHHFKDCYFMNYKKEKLTFEAVPTENGPFCGSDEEDIDTEAAEAFSFVVNEIENEPYFDKKANSSLKYSDFLTNLDVPVTKTVLWPDDSDLTFLPNVISNHENVSEVKTKFFQNVVKVGSKSKDRKQHDYAEHSKHSQKSNNLVSALDSDKLINYNNSYQESNNINIQSSPNLLPVVPPKDVGGVNFTKQPVLITPFYVDPYFNSLNQSFIPENSINDIGERKEDMNSNGNINQLQNASMFPNKGTPKDVRVKIISEKTITEPVPFVEKLEPVPLSLILRLPSGPKGQEANKAQNTQTQKNEIQISSNEIVPNDLVEIQIPVDIQIPKTSEVLEVNNIKLERPNIDIEELDKNTCATNTPIVKSQHTKSSNKSKEQVGKLSILKNKIAPDRIAAIEKKRSFNKKLRDIVETCLEKSDSQIASNILNAKNTENITNNVRPYHTKEPRLSDTQDKTLASLEARIIKMESMLAKKIEQNSERISELKSCILPHKSTTVSTQTSCNEELYKKYLYNELSNFLSPSTNSLIYEELFINKYAQKISECEPKPKRRRRR